MSSLADPRNSTRFVLMLVLGLLGTQAARFLGVESLYYGIGIALGALHVITNPSSTSWVGFFLLALTSLLYPTQLDELGTSLQGTYRPYILLIAVVAVSTLMGLWFRPGKAYKGRLMQHGDIRARTAALIAVMLLALGYGYFTSVRPPGILDVVRECSGWMTFVVFLFLGFRLSPSPEEIHKSFLILRLSVLAYSGFFIMRFLYLSLSLGADETAAGFGYSQRGVAFFSGLVLILVIAQGLTSEVKGEWRKVWPAGLILLSAVLLTGSRSVLISVLIVTLLFVLVYHSKMRLRWPLLGLAALFVLALGSSLSLPSQVDSESGIVGYVTNRFLVASTEDASLLARASEMVAVGEALRENPLLGRGPLASYSFFDPFFGWKDTTFVDSGLGYLLMKSGLLGTVVFIWFAVGWLKMERGLRKTLPALGVAPLASFAFYLVFLPFGPSFFVFEHSWFIGLLVGQTIFLGSRLPMASAGRISGALGQPGALA